MPQTSALMPRIRWPYLYLVLVALDIATVATGLWLNQRLAHEHQQAVAAGLAWNSVTAHLDGMAAAADALVAPALGQPDREGDPVPPAALTDRLAAVREHLGRQPVVGSAQAALLRLQAASDRLTQTAGAADPRAVAASRLAVTREIDAVRAHTRATHDGEMAASRLHVTDLRRLFYGLVALALATTLVVATYGLRLVGRIRRQDRQTVGFLVALEASELRKAAVISASLDAIIVMDEDGSITDFNPAAERIFGFRAEQVLGRQAIDTVIPPAARDGYRRALARFRASSDARHLGRRVETAGLRADGSEFPVELTVTPARIADQILFTAHVRDITERKEQEDALRRSNRELEQFAYVASHDLQEPLRMVSSYLALLEKRYRAVLDDKGREFIAHSVDGAERMHALINGLLTYSRVDRGEAPQEAVIADAALSEALEYLRPRLLEAGAEVTHDLLPSVQADRVQLVQLFQNLVGNAIKYRGQAPPRVHVAAQRDGERWRITVRDNGIGIDPAYHERIFEIFQRLHTRAEYPGTGIGLAICKKIVERHGGRLWVESAKGEGAVFCFTVAEAGSGRFRMRRERSGESSTALRVVPPPAKELSAHG